MRRYWIGILCSAFLISAAGPASANTTHDLLNYTETWIGFEGGEFFISGFEFDQNSDFELVDFQPSVLQHFIQFSGSAIGAIVEITIPNFFDPLPTKLIDISFFGANGGAGPGELPYVLSIIGADAPFGGAPGPSLPVFAMFNNGTTESTEVHEFWEMHPNPDFETVTVFIPTAFEFLSMHITTQSIGEVPEPGVLVLLGGGFAGLLFAGRRRG